MRDGYVADGSDDPGIQAVAAAALALVVDGTRIGIGTGRAASAFIAALGARVREGLRVHGVPTSRVSAEAARKAGIPLLELGQDMELEVTVDGADEVAPNLDLVKGWGGALVRERIVAAASKRQVILVTEEKLVAALGEHRRVPVEVIPLARWIAMKQLNTLGIVPTLRTQPGNGEPFISDNGNLLIDCAPSGPVRDRDAARDLEQALLGVVGVVDTGLFLGTADTVFVGHPDRSVSTLRRTGAGQ
jgi:ribose 5-phosphate isomerase A